MCLVVSEIHLVFYFCMEKMFQKYFTQCECALDVILKLNSDFHFHIEWFLENVESKLWYFYIDYHTFKNVCCVF